MNIFTLIRSSFILLFWIATANKVFAIESTTANSLVTPEVIYSNLGPTGEFSLINAYSIGYPFKENEVGQSIAFSFISNKKYYLTSVDLAVGFRQGFGSNEFTVAIYEDVLGKPNNILTSVVATAPQGFPIRPDSTIHVIMPGAITLKAGEKYWIGLHPATAQPTDIGWWWNPDNDQLQSLHWQSNTPTEVLLGGMWERSFVTTEAAYQVNGFPEGEVTFDPALPIKF